MDIRQLKYFHAVAKHKSLTAASEALNVTQPAIGQQIRKLEESLGLKLLSRHSRGMKLTAVGRVLDSRAAEILAAIERTEKELSRFRNSTEATIRVGVTPSLSRVLVPRLMELCFDRHPSITLLFTHGFPQDLYRQWENGESDFAFVHEDIDTPEAESLPLYMERICLIGAPLLCRDLPETVPIAKVSELPIVLDGRSVWVRECLQREFRKLKLDWSDLIEIHSLEIRREYMVQKRRMSIAPIAQFKQELDEGLVESRRIDFDPFHRTVFLAGPRIEMMSEAEKRVRGLIIEIADEFIAAGDVGWTSTDWQGPDITAASNS